MALANSVSEGPSIFSAMRHLLVARTLIRRGKATFPHGNYSKDRQKAPFPRPKVCLCFTRGAPKQLWLTLKPYFFFLSSFFLSSFLGNGLSNLESFFTDLSSFFSAFFSSLAIVYPFRSGLFVNLNTRATTPCGGVSHRDRSALFAYTDTHAEVTKSRAAFGVPEAEIA